PACRVVPMGEGCSSANPVRVGQADQAGRTFSGSTSSHTDRAWASSWPPEYSAVPAVCLRPSPPVRQDITTHSAPTAGSSLIGAVVVPSTNGRPPTPRAPPPGQSSADQAISPVTSRGTQEAAKTCSATGPGRRHKASSGSRCVPQEKQVGNGWSVRPG